MDLLENRSQRWHWPGNRNRREVRLLGRAKARGQVNGGGGLSYATFLVCNRDDSRQENLDWRKLSKGLGHMQEVSRETGGEGGILRRFFGGTLFPVPRGTSKPPPFRISPISTSKARFVSLVGFNEQVFVIQHWCERLRLVPRGTHFRFGAQRRAASRLPNCSAVWLEDLKESKAIGYRYRFE